jgi:hypothetical protein
MSAVFTRPTIVGRLSAAPNGSLALSLAIDSIEQWVMRNIPTNASAAKR